MKIRKVTGLLLSMFISAMLCGCDSDIPGDLYDQVSSLEMAAIYPVYSARVDKEHYEFADNCFSDIEILNTTLTLPMNVSDLPDGFTIESYSLKSIYNGYCIDHAELYYDEKSVIFAEIMYPIGKDQSDGQIVTFISNNSLLGDGTTIYLAGEYGFMTINEVIEHFGECEKGDYMTYDLGDGRSIRFSYWSPYRNTVETDALSIRLDAINKIW